MRFILVCAEKGATEGYWQDLFKILPPGPLTMSAYVGSGSSATVITYNLVVTRCPRVYAGLRGPKLDTAWQWQSCQRQTMSAPIS
jgi:hypothetical protein